MVSRYLPAPQSVHSTEPTVSLYFPHAHAEHALPSVPVYPAWHWQLVRRLVPLGDCELLGQEMHVLSVEAPVVVEYVLAPQAVQVLAADAPAVVEYLPASQSVHVLATEAPVLVRYLPAAQSVHPTEPISSLYFPAAHAAHVSPSAPVCPAWQRQLVRRILPLRDCEFGGQEMHVSAVEAPGVVEYVLAPQSMQVPVIEAPAVMEYFPEAQFVQVLATEAPVVTRYLPAPQSVHPTEPISSLYFPASHAVHVPPLPPVYPALHWQLVKALLPGREIEFSGQGLHAAEPELALNSPARHRIQVCPSAAVAPGLQVQSVRRADSGGEFEFAGQSWQVGLPSADHEPASHGSHVSAPVAPTAAE